MSHHDTILKAKKKLVRFLVDNLNIIIIPEAYKFNVFVYDHSVVYSLFEPQKVLTFFLFTHFTFILKTNRFEFKFKCTLNLIQSHRKNI